MAKAGAGEVPALLIDRDSMPMMLAAVLPCFEGVALNPDDCSQRGGDYCHRGLGAPSRSDVMSINHLAPSRIAPLHVSRDPDLCAIVRKWVADAVPARRREPG